MEKNLIYRTTHVPNTLSLFLQLDNKNVKAKQTQPKWLAVKQVLSTPISAFLLFTPLMSMINWKLTKGTGGFLITTLQVYILHQYGKD